MLDMQLCVTTNKENMVFTKNKEKIVVNKNININIDSYPISMAILIVPNIVDSDIDVLVTPALQYIVLGIVPNILGEQ